MSDKFYETERRCQMCGEKVLIGNGMYYCDCTEVGLAYLDQGALDFPDYWVREETENEVRDERTH